MPQYIVHLVETRFYDVPVEADSEEEAYELASTEDRWLDRKVSGVELASWPRNAIEEVL